jgi:hypothetical protein
VESGAVRCLLQLFIRPLLHVKTSYLIKGDLSISSHRLHSSQALINLVAVHTAS